MFRFSIVEFDDYFQSVAEAIGIDLEEHYALVATKEQAAEIAKRWNREQVALLVVVPDIDGSGDNRDNITDDVTTGFFFLANHDQKDRATFRDALALAEAKLKAFLEQLDESIGTGSCSFITRAMLEQRAISPEFNLFGTSGWFLSFPISY